MIDALFNQPNYSAAKKLLDATALRHEAIASNLANLETPHYKRLDLAPSFSAQLQTAIAGGNPASLSELQPSLAVDTTAVGCERDGNTVQLESELLHLQQNTMEHALETQLVAGSLSRLRLAVTGRA
jgi:flagellar basal-body rod protein FlgB